MPRGQPDYGLYAPKEVGSSISDMGEVAARLGSIDIFDKRGDVVTFDAFEEPILKWVIGTTPAASYVFLDSTHAKSGSQSAKLYHTNIIDSYAIIDKYLSILASKQLGIEISWHGHIVGGELDFYLTRYDGTTAISANLQLNHADGKLYILSSGGSWVEVTTVSFPPLSDHEFRTMKLVADFKTEKYVRLLLDLNEYNISAIPLYKVPSVIRPYIQAGLQFKAKTAVEDTLWADDFILTQAEP